MPTQEIKQTNWGEFCKRFETDLRGSLVSVDVIHHDGATELLARNLPLREVRFVQTDGCSDLIRINLGDLRAENVEHEIVDPIHVRLREEPGTQKILQIDGESGSVEIRFSSGRVGAMLYDLQMT